MGEGNEELSWNWYGCKSNKHAEWSANWIDMSFRATSAAVSTFHIIRRAQKEKKIKHFKALTVEYLQCGSRNESKKKLFLFLVYTFYAKTNQAIRNAFIYLRNSQHGRTETQHFHFVHNLSNLFIHVKALRTLNWCCCVIWKTFCLTFHLNVFPSWYFFFQFDVGFFVQPVWRVSYAWAFANFIYCFETQ